MFLMEFLLKLYFFIHISLQQQKKFCVYCLIKKGLLKTDLLTVNVVNVEFADAPDILNAEHFSKGCDRKENIFLDE